MRYGRGGPKVAPERQRKIDAITAALKPRGYEFHTLTSGAGGWEVSATQTPGVPLVAGDSPWISLRGYDFATVLHTVEDDVAWAQRVHGLRGHELREVLSRSRRALGAHLDAYALHQRVALVAELDGDEATRAKSAGLAEAARIDVGKAHAAVAVAQSAFEGYQSTMPQDADAAVAYLTALPRSTGD